MKRVKLLFFCILYCVIFAISSNTNAKQYLLEEIPDDAYIIGTHMFSSSLTPETTSFYSGLVDSSAVMLGSTTIDASGFESSADFVIYYKIFGDIWIDSLTGNDITPPEVFEITHINGQCVDASCMGNAIEVWFNSTDGLNDVFQTTHTNVGYGEKISASAVPTLNNRPGYKFVCWTLKNQDECFDLSTAITDELKNEDGKVELETKWEQITYKITYYNYDDSTQTQECTYNNLGNSEIDCKFMTYDELFGSRANYTFLGWTLVKDGSTIYEDTSDISAILGNQEEISLYAKFEANSFTISYDLDGGTFVGSVSPQTIFTVLDETMELPEVSKLGYEFKNWSYNDEVFDGTLPEANIAIKAVYEPIQYTFTYKEQVVTCTYDSECDINITDNDVPEGMTFSRWYIENENNKVYLGSSVKNFTTEKDMNYTLVPEYVLNKYFVTYDLDGGTIVGNVSSQTSFTIEDESIILPEVSKAGYTFARWEISSGTGLEIDGNIGNVVGASDTKLKAIWTENDYSIEYYNDSTLVDTRTCKYSSCTIEEITVSRDGYDFDGWISEKSKLVYHTDSKLSLVDLEESVIKLSAKWTNKYRNTISYNLNGGIITVGEAPASYLEGEEVSLPIPTKEGYTFTGWSIGDTTLTDSKIVGYNEDLDVTANWTANTYTIKFMMDGADIEPVYCTYDTDCSFGDHSSQVPSNKKLIGWSLDNSGTLYYGDNLIVKNLKDGTEANKELILYAVLEDTTIYRNVSYYLDGGNLDLEIANTIADGETLTLPTPSKDGYTFAGWYEVNTQSIYTDSIDVTNDVLLIAKWEILTYKITYVDENGDPLSVDTSIYPVSYSYDTEKLIIPGGSYLPDGISGWKIDGTELNKTIVSGVDSSSYEYEIIEKKDIVITGIKSNDTDVTVPDQGTDVTDPDQGTSGEEEQPSTTTYEVNFYDANSLEPNLLGTVLVVEGTTITSETTTLKGESNYSEYISQEWYDSNFEFFDIENTPITQNMDLFLQ